MLVTVVMGLMMVSCSDNSNPVISEDSTNTGMKLNSGISLADGLASAAFHIYVRQTSGQPVNIHRVTGSWEELVVTWNNFGGSYTSDIYGSFIADQIGWYEIDITILVSGWMNGDYNNYGLLLAQNELSFPRTVYNSSENAANQPYLEICYDDGSTCEITAVLADAFISEYEPDDNYGSGEYLITGWPDARGVEKHSLIQFEIEVNPPDEEEGCTYTIGYWKNHAGFGPQADMVTGLLPIWLGTANGDKSINVTTARKAVEILSQHVYGHASNGITKLYAQLLGAKLNITTGASYEAIDDIIDEADTFLANHNWTEWRNLADADKNMVLGWHETLDDYNNGIIGPGHCDEQNDIPRCKHHRHGCKKCHKK